MTLTPKTTSPGLLLKEAYDQAVESYRQAHYAHVPAPFVPDRRVQSMILKGIILEDILSEGDDKRLFPKLFPNRHQVPVDLIGIRKNIEDSLEKLTQESEGCQQEKYRIDMDGAFEAYRENDRRILRWGTAFGLPVALACPILIDEVSQFSKYIRTEGLGKIIDEICFAGIVVSQAGLGLMFGGALGMMAYGLYVVRDRIKEGPLYQAEKLRESKKAKLFQEMDANLELTKLDIFECLYSKVQASLEMPRPTSIGPTQVKKS